MKRSFQYLILFLFFAIGLAVVAQGQNGISIDRILNTKWKTMYMNPCQKEREIMSVGTNQWIRFYQDNRFEIQDIGADPRFGTWNYDHDTRMLDLKENDKARQKWKLIDLNSRNMVIEITQNGACRRITYQKVLE